MNAAVPGRPDWRAPILLGALVLLVVGLALRQRPRHPATPILRVASAAPLTVAVTIGDWQHAELLLHAGADPNRGPVLADVISGGQLAFARELLAHGAAVNPLDGASPLAAAIQLLSPAMLKLAAEGPTQNNPFAPGHYTEAEALLLVRSLVERGADVNGGAQRPGESQADDETTPATAAARTGRLDVLTLLTAHGAHLGSLSSGQEYLLYDAAMSGNTAVWDYLVHHGARADPTLSAWAYVWSERCLDTRWVRRLQSVHIPINMRSRPAPGVSNASQTYGDTPLMLAAGTATRVRALLQLGANVRQRDSSGDTALHCAAETGDAAAVPLLLDRGSRVDDRNSEGATPLLLAARACHFAVVDVLLRSGARADIGDNGGVTALECAAEAGDPSAVERLLAAGAHAEPGREGLGRTPLISAILGGDRRVVRELIAAGALVDTPDRYGTPPIIYAVRRGNPGVLHQLLAAGADAGAAAADGKTPLSEARRLHVARIERLLVAAVGAPLGKAQPR